MTRRIYLRARARIAIVELRCLLVSDAPISVKRRRRLIEQIVSVMPEPDRARAISQELESLIGNRFGRNPDTFQPSYPTLQALKLLASLQSEKMIELSVPSAWNP